MFQAILLDVSWSQCRYILHAYDQKNVAKPYFKITSSIFMNKFADIIIIIIIIKTIHKYHH
jgi:hypothetical protein